MKVLLFWINANNASRLAVMMAATLLSATTTLPAAEVNTGTLLDDIVNLERLTKAPDPAYKTFLFCSYERTATKPGEEGRLANLDGPGNATNSTYLEELQAPGPDGVGRYLIVDVEGPGAIVRTQTADIKGDLKDYTDRDSRTPTPPPAAADVRPPRMPEGWKPVPDALRWTPEREGEEMTLTFQSPGKGRYELRPSMVFSPESGKVLFKLNGKDLVNPWLKPPGLIVNDLYTPHHTMMRYVWLPAVELEKGPQTLTLVFMGKSPNSKGMAIGGDFFW